VSAAEFKRADRVGSAMQRELAVLIRDLKDLPGGLVTVQEVRVSRDLSHAKVYFTVIGADADDTLADLKHAAGYLRRELGHAMRLRSVPELHFVYDTSIADGERLDSLIETAVARDGHVRTEDDG
jgi:ribosome-binding factor A